MKAEILVRSKRMIPALGTFIRLELDLSGELFLQYSELMFSEIKRVEKKFSFFDESSELSQINRMEIFQWKDVSFEMEDILKLSQSIAEDSKQAFDPGPKLEFKTGSVRKIEAGQIDLGGIAKGYAVDCAVKALFQMRFENNDAKIFGSLNAGGDLFLFEEKETQVHLEISPGVLKAYGLTRGAVATSLAPTSGDLSSGSKPSELSAHYRGRPALHVSVSVFAEQAVIADAFTKVALFSHDREIFKKWNAKVLHEV